MQRPAGVTILAVLNYLVGACLFVVSIPGLLVTLWVPPLAVLFWGVIALILSLGYGLWKLRSWARQTQIVLSMIGAVGCLLLTIEAHPNGFDIVYLLLGPGLTAVNVVIILYLLRPQVKQAFGGKSFA